jgi:hypothetical protein
MPKQSLVPNQLAAAPMAEVVSALQSDQSENAERLEGSVAVKFRGLLTSR